MEMVQITIYTISALPCACYRFTALIRLSPVLFVFLNFQPSLGMGSFAFLFYFFTFHNPGQDSAISFSWHLVLKRLGSTLTCLPSIFYQFILFWSGHLDILHHFFKLFSYILACDSVWVDKSGRVILASHLNKKTALVHCVCIQVSV